MEEMSYVFSFTFFFSLPLIFTLVAASISHFLTAATKFSCCSSNKWWWWWWCRWSTKTWMSILFFNSSLRPETRTIFLFLIMQLKDNMNRFLSICVAYKSQICDLSMVESHEGILISFDSFASLFWRCRSSEVSP